jgi:hypothetical protein
LRNRYSDEQERHLNPASVYTHCETAIEAELVDRNSSFSSAAGAKQAAEKVGIRAKSAESIPQGLKAHDDYIAFTPGINPRPTLKPSFSAACKAQFSLSYLRPD